jgi:hypothetical protein
MTARVAFEKKPVLLGLDLRCLSHREGEVELGSSLSEPQGPILLLRHADALLFIYPRKEEPADDKEDDE